MKRVEITGGLMHIDTDKESFDMQEIENRRFLYNPKTHTLILGVQTKSFIYSHAQELVNSGNTRPYDEFVRGWIGTGEKYKNGIIHFSPPVPSHYPELFNKGFDAIEMFSKNNANGKTVVRGFGRRWEQPLADILLQRKEADIMADKNLNGNILSDAAKAKQSPEQTEGIPVKPITLTADKQKDKLKEITDKLEQGVKDIFASDKYREYLNVMSKFHNYSFRNSILILLQKPDASMIAGYGAWQKNFKRQVKKGEKGIKIIAPAPFKMKKEVEKINPKTNQPYMKDGKPVTQEIEVTVPAYKVTNVFDVSQTDGEPIPSLNSKLYDSVENYKDFYNALEKLSPVPIGFENIKSGANGYFNPTEQRIAVQENMSELQTLKTLIHEIAHSKLHDYTTEKAKELPPEERKDAHTKEVEAESVAYTVCMHYGLDTSDYTFGYVAGWSSSAELEELHNSLATIQKTANEIIHGIDGYFTELERDRSVTRTEQTAPEASEPVKSAAETKTQQQEIKKSSEPEPHSPADEFVDLPDDEASEAAKLFNEPQNSADIPTVSELEKKAKSGEVISLMALAAAVNNEQTKTALGKGKSASKKPSIRKQLADAKEQTAKRQPKQSAPSKKKEVAR